MFGGCFGMLPAAATCPEELSGAAAAVLPVLCRVHHSGAVQSLQAYTFLQSRVQHYTYP
jgi:hypothetical protein